MTETQKEITVIAIVLIAVVTAFVFSIPANAGRPQRDVCNAPPGILQRCYNSADCNLTANEYARYLAYENTLDRLCPDR